MGNARHDRRRRLRADVPRDRADDDPDRRHRRGHRALRAPGGARSSRSRSRSSSGCRSPSYFGGEAEPMRTLRMRRTLYVLAGLALAAPGAASAADFDPSKEFELKPWVSIHLGPLDMSINKAVVYLFIGGRALVPVRDRLHARASSRRSRAGARRSASSSTTSRRPRSPSSGLPAKALGAVVPVLRDAADLHLGHQHARLHPAAADRRDLARDPGVGDLRGDLVALGHARARVHDVDRPRTSRASAGTARSSTSSRGSRRCRRRSCR